MEIQILHNFSKKSMVTGKSQNRVLALLGCFDEEGHQWVQYQPLCSCAFSLCTQARSQDRFFGGCRTPKCETLGPKGELFEPHPPHPLTKTPFLAHFVTKSGPFGRFGGCVARTLRTPLATGLFSPNTILATPGYYGLFYNQGTFQKIT